MYLKRWCGAKVELWVHISMLLHQPWGCTYQFDGHIFVSIEIFSQPQLSKVPAADFFTHTEVWANHKNSRIGPWTPAPMSSPAACCLRHLFPFLCLSLAPSLVKIHKLVIPWPLHGYSPAMQTIETPITTTEEALEREKGGQSSQDRGKVLLLKCAMVQKTLKQAETTAEVPRVSVKQLFCWVLPFFFSLRVPCLPEGLLSCVFLQLQSQSSMALPDE